MGEVYDRQGPVLELHGLYSKLLQPASQCVLPQQDSRHRRHAGKAPLFTLQTIYTFLKEGGLETDFELKPLEVASLMIAAACHDFNHPGTNNKYQIDAQNHLAVTYNGKSV